MFLISCRFGRPVTAKKDARFHKPGVFIEDYYPLIFPNFLTKFGNDAAHRRLCDVGVRGVACRGGSRLRALRSATAQQGAFAREGVEWVRPWIGVEQGTAATT